MIGRIGHGWTTPQNAEKYEGLLKEEIFSAIAEKKFPDTTVSSSCAGLSTVGR